MLRLKFIIALIICAIPMSLTAKVECYQGEYRGVPRSEHYNISITHDTDVKQECVVFRNRCEDYVNHKGKDGDRRVLERWRNHSISWSHVSADSPFKVVVKVTKPIGDQPIKILPSRKGVEATKVDDHTIEFEIRECGQYSVEIGSIVDWMDGLLLFVDPIEGRIPDVNSKNTLLITPEIPISDKLSKKIRTLYFDNGVHDLGIYEIPSHVKEVYISGGAWVHGALKIKGAHCSGTIIHGRGVLSGAKQQFRDAHQIEISGGAEDCIVRGITVADYSHFGVRALGGGHATEWVKIVGGWIYNCDGLCAWDDAVIRNCFIWANDDNIKLYGSNVLVEDCFCWQLNNGAIFQLAWGRVDSKNVTVRRIDVAKAAFSGTGLNHGVINRRYAGGFSHNYLIEDVVVESPINSIINLRPEANYKHVMLGLSSIHLRNWSVQASPQCVNYIERQSGTGRINGVTIENLVINGTKVTGDNCDKFNFNIKGCSNLKWK